MCSGTSEFKRQDNLCMKWVLWESLFREWMSCMSTTPFVNLDYLNTVTVFHFSCYLVHESAERNQWISLKYTGVSRTRLVLYQFKAFVRYADILKISKYDQKGSHYYDIAGSGLSEDFAGISLSTMFSYHVSWFMIVKCRSNEYQWIL